MKEATLEIPTGLFRSTRTSARNDRYVVYHMLNRMVSFRDAATGTKVSGFVDEVYRDIFAGEVRLTIRGRVYKFKEPVTVQENTSDIVFIYGDRYQKECSDKKLFAEMRNEKFRETASDTMTRLAPKRVKETRFFLGDRKPSRKKPFLMRGIQADVSEMACCQ